VFSEKELNMKRSIILSMLFHSTSLVCSSAPSANVIDENELCVAIGQNLGISDVELLPSIHGGDNKVFFIKNGTSVIGIAKCYTKRNVHEVEAICQLSQVLCKALPIPRVMKLFMFNNNIPVVLQDFLSGKHYEHLNEKQLENIALSMAKIHSVSPNSGNLIINDKEFDYDQLLDRCTSFPDFKSILSLYRSLDLKYFINMRYSLFNYCILILNIMTQNTY